MRRLRGRTYWLAPSRDTAVWSRAVGAGRRRGDDDRSSGYRLRRGRAPPALVGPGQLTFHQNDPYALAERLRGLLDNPDRLQEKADDAYRRSWSLRPEVLAVRLIAFWQEARSVYEKRQAPADRS